MGPVAMLFALSWCSGCGMLTKRLLSAHRERLKKISEVDGAVLFPWRKALVNEAFRARDVRVQWNLSLVLGRLPLRARDKAVVVDLMFERLRDPSGLNRTCALQALMDLSANDAALRRRVRTIMEEFMENGTPAMKARAKKLMPLLRDGVRGLKSTVARCAIPRPFAKYAKGRATLI